MNLDIPWDGELRASKRGVPMLVVGFTSVAWFGRTKTYRVFPPFPAWDPDMVERYTTPDLTKAARRIRQLEKLPDGKSAHPPHPR